VGTSANNTLTGNTGANQLTGGAGSDTLDGGAGADVAVFSGNSANYSVTVNAALGNVIVTALTGADGTDTLTGIEQLQFADGVMLIPVLLTAGNDTYTGTVDADVVYGLAGADTLTGGAGSDQLYGDAGADSLVGGDGDDMLSGGAGNDVLIGGAGNDTASYAEATTAVTVNLATTAQQNTGGGGRDTLTTLENVIGGSAADRLTGDANANRLDGGAGADVLTGGAGNDVLIGGLGLDTLTGGTGLDTFLFNVDPTAANRDTISAFSVVDDTIQLDSVVFAALGVGALDVGAFNNGTAATDATDRIVYNAANGALYYDADGLGGATAIQFATFTGLVGTLTSSDFVIV
jgi:Ca2+-binding RTX toxin-like protein